MAVEGDAAIAILTRIESVNDRVTDISSGIRVVAEHTRRLNKVEETVDTIHDDIQLIKQGPVYSLDQFITKRVAQVSGGMGATFLAIIIALQHLGWI